MYILGFQGFGLFFVLLMEKNNKVIGQPPVSPVAWSVVFDGNSRTPAH